MREHPMHQNGFWTHTILVRQSNLNIIEGGPNVVAIIDSYFDVMFVP